MCELGRHVRSVEAVSGLNLLVGAWGCGAWRGITAQERTLECGAVLDMGIVCMAPLSDHSHKIVPKICEAEASTSNSKRSRYAVFILLERLLSLSTIDNTTYICCILSTRIKRLLTLCYKRSIMPLCTPEKNQKCKR